MTRRLVLGAVYLLLAVVIGLAVPFGITLGRRLTEELGGRVEREAFAVSAAIEDLMESARFGSLQRVAERFSQEIGGRVLVTSPEGTLLADSLDPPGATPPSYGTRPEVARALGGDANWDVRRSETLDRDLMVSAVPIRSGTRILGAVRISYPMTEVESAIRRAYWFLAGVGAVALGAGLLLAMGLARWATRPIDAAAAAARRIAAGDLGARVPVTGPPEVQALATDMNLMTRELDDLLRANRRFAADASHQLRTPLTALRLNLENAVDAADPGADLTAALEQAHRLERTVEALLSLGGEGRSEPQAIDLVGPVRDAIASLPPGVAVEIEGTGRAFADPERVRQVALSLIENARRFARERVVVSLADRDGTTVLAVDDDGPGIPEQERSRVFDRFYQGGGVPSGGAGLGLAVARELARVDRAGIVLGHSELGGARFEVSYPAADISSRSAAVAKRKPTPRMVRM